MPAVPSYLLKKVYLRGSLKNTSRGFELTLKNSLAPATILGLNSLAVDGEATGLNSIELEAGSGPLSAGSIDTSRPLAFALNTQVTLRVEGEPLAPGRHSLMLNIQTKEAGPLEIPIADTI